MYKNLLYTANMLKTVPLLAANNVVTQQTRVSNDQNWQSNAITSNFRRAQSIHYKTNSHTLI